MNRSLLKPSLTAIFALLLSMTFATAQRQVERLGRGIVALRTSSTQVYLSWRLLGNEPVTTGFNVYRSTNGAAAAKLNASPITQTSDFLDVTTSTTLTSANSYFVKPVVNGVEGAASAAFSLPANAPVRQYLAITKTPVPSGSYSLSQTYPADVDGDGEFELICRLDYAGSGTPADGRFIFDCYKLDGSHLWRVRGGPGLINSNDGDGYLNAADYDGDGKAEVAIRTTAGSVFQNGATITDTSSQEFISIVNGMTGVEMARTPFKPALGPDIYGYWGENMRPFYMYMATAYLDGVHPSLITCRGIGGNRLHIHAWDFKDGAITERWSWIANDTEYMATGHNLLIYDLDNDQKDEIVFIGGAIDDDGTYMYSTGLGHGDHLRFADLDPDRPGFECYAIQQDAALGAIIYDGSNGKAIRKWYLNTPSDPSRGDAGDVDANFRGAEVWSIMPNIWSAKGEMIGPHGIFPSRGIWWDRDLQREIYSGAGSGLYAPVINKINANHDETRLYSIYNEGVTQGYGGFPPFSGDLLGDWREEVVLDTGDRTQIRIYTTKIPAENRFYTLMHNPAYRVGATCKGRTGGMSPDYYLGGGMAPVPPPPIVESDLVWKGGVASNIWDVNTTANWKKAAASLKYLQGQSVLFDLTGTNSPAVQLATTLTPSSVTVHSPIPYTFSGAGSFSGTMPLVKAGAGNLTFTGIHTFTGPTTVWDGALIVNGKFTQSPVTVYGGTWGGALAGGMTGGRIGGTGEFGNGVTLQYGGSITPGSGMGSAGTLTVKGTLMQVDAVANCFDLSDDPSGSVKANDRLQVTGNLDLSGTNTIFIKPLNGVLAPGTYTLITYSGSLTGGLENLKLAGLPGVPAFLANPPGAITLVVPALRAAASITWSGSESGDWDLAQTSNWLRAASSDLFVPGDAVRFDDTGAARPAVNLSTVVKPASVTVSSTSNYTFSGPGGISGSGGLTKSGSGTLTLLTDNDYTGVTNIQGGVLEVDTLAEAGQASPIGAAGTLPNNLLLNACTFRMLNQGGGFTDRGATLGTGGVTIDVLTTSGGMTLGGTVTGAGKLTKTGPGTLQFTAANTYTGGTVINGGTISLGTVAANSSGLGSGAVTFLNGTLNMANIESYASAYWNMIVPSGSSGRLNADGRCSLRGSLTGGGTFTVYGPYVRTDLYGDWSQFTGKINMLGDLRVANTFGFGNAAVSMGDSNLYYINTLPAAGVTLDLGELSGVAAARLRGAATATNVLTWRVGGLNTDATFAGNIEEQNTSSVTAINKVGTGIWTLSGTHTYRGATTVSAGTLVLTGTITGSNVTVKNAATLNNLGTITGNVTIETGGTLTPVGTIVGNLTNYGTVRVTGNDMLSVNGTFTNYGTLDLGSWGGTLPANFINYGTIISAPLPTIAITSPVADPVMLPGITTELLLRATVTAGITHQWSLVAGPGTATFSDASALETHASFSAPGAYILQFSATNNSGTVTARRGVLVGSNQTYTFRQGENGYSHTCAMIREDTNTWNSGGRDQFLVGRTGSRLRGVLAFELPANLPANAITAASLDLWTAATAGTVADLQLHALSGIPTEGSGSSSSDAANGATTGVTWIRRTDATENLNWTSAGGDFNPTVLTTISGFAANAVNSQKTFASTAGFVGAVQAALSAGSPLGLLIQSPDTTTNNQYVRFASDDFATIGQRPLLTLQLSGSPLPTGNPGPAPAATEGLPAPLAGGVSNGAIGTWSFVSGPGSAVFANASQAATTVTFSLPGTYVLRFTAANASGETAANLTVSVNANPLAPGTSAEVNQNATVEIPLPMSDPENDPLTVQSFSQGTHGTVSITGTTASYSASDFVGDDTFTYTVSDGRGGLATGTVTVSIQDITPPILSLPATLIVEASSAAGASVAFTPSATDAVSGACPVTCNPPSGSVFPLGNTTVTVTAADASGNSSSATFVITVRDTSPPVINVPADLTIPATSASGAVATFETSAFDAVSGSLATTNSHPSGAAFPIGTTTVTASATDAAGNTGSRDFTVTVTAASVVTITSPATDSAAIPDIATTLNLAASVDSIYPATLAWSKFSGPGEITFGNTTSPSTTAQFSANGVYVVQCAATSQAGTASARRTIIVGGAQTVTFRQGENGYSHIAAMIRGDTKTWNSGARDQILVGRLSGGQGLRTVFSFGLDQIPAGASITGVTLDLWTNTENGTGTVDTLELRPLIGTPVEGSGSSSSNTSDGAGTGVTWNSRNGQTTTGNLWSTPGGDFGTTVLSSIGGFDATIANTARSFPSTPDFVAAVQAAVNDTQPLGLMLVSPVTEQGTSNRYARFASDDSTTSSRRPLLSVTFTGTSVPSVDTGPAVTATNRIFVALNGSASNASTVAWSLISGPGSAVFGDSAQAATTVTFDQPGSYVLRLRAANAAGEVSADLAATVLANSAVFSDWQGMKWPGVSDPAIIGPNADPDGDGIQNLVEFALFLPPDVPGRLPASLVVAGNALEYTYTRSRHATGVSCQVEWSVDLAAGNWSRDGVVETVVLPDPDPDVQTIKATISALNVPRRFVRLRASQQTISSP